MEQGRITDVVQMGELGIVPWERGRDQWCKCLVQTLPDQSFLGLRDGSSARNLSHAHDPLQVRGIHRRHSLLGALQTIRA